MAESDGDIEYLDEDADIVQQCVQVVQPVVPAQTMLDVNVTDNKPPLLVERVPAERKLRKRKQRKEEEDDSDYDPSDDALPPSPPSPPSPRTKKKKTPNKKVKTYIRESVPTIVPILNIEKRKVKEVPKEFKLPVLDRKKCSIRIPDYDDPLCLPVKAIKQEESDIKRLNNWNNVCLEHFRNCDTLLKPEKGNTHRSTRSVVFRNVPNKQTGRMETTLWSKTCVENENGDRKSELFQCVLPRYKEKKILNIYAAPTKRARTFHISDEVILCKEEIKDTGDVLVVYKPKEATSSVFKLARDECKKTDTQEEMEEEDVKMHMKEITHCRMCAQCFQVSWRGMKKAYNKNINCPICSRSTVNVYNLLAHFKTHSSDEIKKYKKIISGIMAQIVEYHYNCRLCREQCGSIKQLRKHITTHRTNETFKCEIGNHMTR